MYIPGISGKMLAETWRRRPVMEPSKEAIWTASDRREQGCGTEDILKSAYAIDFAALQQQLAEAQAEIRRIKTINSAIADSSLSLERDANLLEMERDRLKAELAEACYCCRENDDCWPGCECETRLARRTGGDAK